VLHVRRQKSASLQFDSEFRLTEGYVAGQLVSTGVPLHYWRSANKAEVDFLLDTPQGIAPVEVKSGENKRSASMGVYRDRFSPERAYRISTNNFGEEKGIVSLPLYAAHLLGGER
jgi:predicted AAA+ superfamily ATPase